MKQRPISILFFSNEPTRGGAEEHILTLLRGLDRAYFRPHWICPPELAEKVQTDLPADIELFPLCLRRPSQLGAARRLAQVLRDRRVEILHSHLFYASLFASPIGWLCRIPVILETPHVREQWRRSWLKSRFFVDRLAGRFVDYYIAVSEANARYLVEQKGLPKEKIAVIHNGCDLLRFDPDHRPPAGLKKSLGFGESDPVLAMVGRLEPQKGHKVLLEAMQAVQPEFPRARLVCLGEGSLRGELERQTAALELNGSVRFLGQQSNVEDWLALADLTVLPSFYEGLPLVAIESLAAGRPVVGTTADGTPEVVLNGKTGLTVPPGDSERLAQAICHLLRDPELRLALGRAGRQWVLERFSQERQVQQTQEFYLRVWGRTQAWRIDRISPSRMRTAACARKQRCRIDMDAKTTVIRESRTASCQPGAALPLDPLATLRATICEQVVKVGIEQYGHALRALVLTGSLARDEATFIEEKGRTKLLGDAEFFLIFHERTTLPAPSAVATLSRRIEEHLRQSGIVCQVGLSPVHPAYLRKLRPHIFAYELRDCGRVIWGDPELLSLIPSFSTSGIPREDAWRLLANRMIEQLEVVGELAHRPAKLPQSVLYRTVKLHLDMATSYLVFAGAYAPSYRERAEKIAKLAEDGLPKDQCPFPLAKFAEQVRACTQIKLNGLDGRCGPSQAGAGDFGCAFWEEAVGYARRLWRWELAQLTRTRTDASNGELLEKWMQLQPMPRRLRGWLYVLRKQRWHRSWRNWPDWARQAWKASPRYLVYKAASELFCRLPDLLDSTSTSLEVNWEGLRHSLPAVRPVSENGPLPSWRRLAAEIVWNYHEFLVGTRS